MNKFAAVLFMVGVCLTQSAPVDELYVPIVSQASDVLPNGEYNYSFETGDGSSQEQNAVLKFVDDVQILSVEGKYSYVDSEGVLQTVTYTADENGYHPSGDLLPVAPPVPEAIAKALIYIKEHPYVEERK